MDEIRYNKLADGTVRAVDEDPPPEGKTKPKSILWQLCSLAFGLFWLAPTLYLLYINFTGHIVGPSIGCLRSSCRIDFHKTTQIQQAQDLAKADKNAIAWLQLAAKVLDAWLLAIAGSLVYSTLRVISGRDSASSLPVGFLHIHMELADLRCLLKLFWHRFREVHKEKESEGRRARKRLYNFIIFAASVCIISNLMGPAAAVLIIPSLQWIDVNQASNLWLVKLQSSEPPRGDRISPTCSPGNLTAGNYSCMTRIYGATSDFLAAAAVATADQIFKLPENTLDSRKNALLLPPILQEGNVSFTVNISDYVWVALRQSVRNITADLMDWDMATRTLQPAHANYPDSHIFNRSLDSRLLQRGPTIGQESFCIINNATESPLANDQSVRCYPSRETIICIPAGSGWSNISQARSSFTIIDQDGRTNVSVSIYSASVSLELTNSTSECATMNHCRWDWDTIFSKSQNPPGTRISGPRQMSEYTSDIPTSANSTSRYSILCHSKTILGFANYILNPSPFSNILRLVELNLDETSNSIASAPQLFIHPDWNLAAWTVNQNGWVLGSRGCARRLITAFQNWITKNGDKSQAVLDFANIHRFIALQGLSMVPFETTTKQPSDANASHKELKSKGMVQVWKYSLDSRSSRFGVVVAMLGCICVLVRTWLYWVYKEDVKDATEIMIITTRRMQQFPILKFNNQSQKLSFYG